MRRLGVVGTFVWDTIHPPGEEGTRPTEDWGGIAYSLAAFEAAPAHGWALVPLVKVGADLRAAADAFLSTLGTVADDRGIVTVPEANNKVELLYRDRARRCERLTGGVPGWTWDELAPSVLSCDALYVNFVAGWEIDLPTAEALAREFEGPSYVDVHSLVLGVGADGVRELRVLPGRDSWLRSFDVVQVNEEELAAVAPNGSSTGTRAESLLRLGPEAVLVTLGADGAEWVAREGVRWLSPGSRLRGGSAVPARRAVDPTGCGDVWGMSCFAALLGGCALPEAVEQANRLAAANATLRGTDGLAERLAALVPPGGSRA